MNEVTIVTAFFDIGRKQFKGFERSNQKYYDYFKFWANIHNQLIVYTDTDDSANKIMAIRQSFGLESKTKVIVIKNVYDIEPDLYKRMVKASQNKWFAQYRYMPNSADNNPNYDYIMMLKTYFICEAVRQEHVKGLIAWLDFGFNHGGDTFKEASEFNFLWKTDLPKDKITYIFYHQDDHEPIFKMVESYNIKCVGGLFVIPDTMAELAWKEIKRAMNSLLDCDFLDDDQTLMVMFCRQNKVLFNIIYGDCIAPFKQMGASQLTLVDKTNKKVRFKDWLLKPYRIRKRNQRMHKNMKSLFDKDYLD